MSGCSSRLVVDAGDAIGDKDRPIADARQVVEAHYSRGAILSSILGALRDMGSEVTTLAPSDLAPVDEFNVGGRAPRHPG